MNTSSVEGWSVGEYKSFRTDDEETSGSESDDEPIVRGYRKEKYRKILVEEALLPE